MVWVGVVLTTAKSGLIRGYQGLGDSGFALICSILCPVEAPSLLSEPHKITIGAVAEVLDAEVGANFVACARHPQILVNDAIAGHPIAS